MNVLLASSSFTLFSSGHLLTLGVIALLLIMLITLYFRSADSGKKHLSFLLACCCFASHPLHLSAFLLTETSLSLENILPFHLCDLAAIICGLALLNRSPKLCEIAYFWGLAATLQGLLTPDLSVSFPDPHYLSFFWNHGFVVISALFLPIALKWRPNKHAVWRVFGITQLYAVLAITLNSMLGTNYGFLARKPSSASLLDFFPEWPWYILILEVLCILLLLLLNLPFSKKSEK